MEVDIYRKKVDVDLHKYSARTAAIIVREKAREAFEHGFRHVRFIHGAGDIKNKNDGGSIKFALRSMIKNGGLDNYIIKNNSVLNNDFVVLEIKKNPAPLEKEWEELPLPDF